MSMPDLVTSFLADEADIDRHYFFPSDEEQLTQLSRLYKTWGRRLREIDYDRLGRDERVDFHILKRRVKLQRKRASHRSRTNEEMSDVARLVRPLGELDPRGRRSSGREAAVLGGAIAEVASNVDALPVDEKRARATIEALGRARGRIDRWYGIHQQFDPRIGWWLDKPIKELRTRLQGKVKELASKLDGDEFGIVREPLGAGRLEHEIRLHFLPASADELRGAARRDAARTTEALEETATELGHGRDWRRALRQVVRNQSLPGTHDDFIAGLANECIAFCREHDFVTVPEICARQWNVHLLSSDEQKQMPFAFYDARTVYVAFASREMDHEKKLLAMKAGNRHFSRVIVPHELVPGHHLQDFLARRHRAYRAGLENPFMKEGWPTYVEMALVERGFADDPADRLAFLFWRLHRAARVEVTLGYHLGELDAVGMREFLVDHVGHEKQHAHAEVTRYLSLDFEPLYPCGYLLGALQLAQVHRDLVDARGMSERRVHDAMAASTAVPPALLHAQLAGKDIPRDWRPRWRP